LFSHACYMPCPSHPLPDHSNGICRGLQITRRLVMQLSSAFCYFIPLRSKYCPSLNVRHEVSTPIKETTSKITSFM
jgi:hypothetical protein